MRLRRVRTFTPYTIQIWERARPPEVWHVAIATDVFASSSKPDYCDLSPGHLDRLRPVPPSSQKWILWGRATSNQSHVGAARIIGSRYQANNGVIARMKLAQDPFKTFPTLVLDKRWRHKQWIALFKVNFKYDLLWKHRHAQQRFKKPPLRSFYVKRQNVYVFSCNQWQCFVLDL